MTTSAQLLLAWQTKQTAQRKPGLSFSALGGCHRRAGYLLAGTTPTNESASVQSAMGSAAHDKIAEAARELFPDDLVEHPVEFAGIPGTLDRYDVARRELIDTKTTSSRWLAHVKLHGISREWRYQTAGYAAGLHKQGHKVRTIRLDVLARDTGEEWTTTRRFDPKEVAEALEWVNNIRSVPLEMTNRDYLPDSPFCAGCPFRDTCWGDSIPDRSPLSVLYVDDPDARKWAEQLAGARAVIAEAKKLEAEAKGALDALRPNTTGRSDPVDIGWDWDLQWTVSQTTRLGTGLVRAEYAKAGAKPPTNTSTSTKLGFVPKPDPREEEA